MCCLLLKRAIMYGGTMVSESSSERRHMTKCQLYLKHPNSPKTRQKKRKLHLKLPQVVILCGHITDYRTFTNDFRKCAEFVRWLKEKAEG